MFSPRRKASVSVIVIEKVPGLRVNILEKMRKPVKGVVAPSNSTVAFNTSGFIATKFDGAIA